MKLYKFWRTNMSRPVNRMAGALVMVAAGSLGACQDGGSLARAWERGWASPGKIGIVDIPLPPGSVVTNPTALCQEVTKSPAYNASGGPYIGPDRQTYQHCVSNPPPNGGGYEYGQGFGGGGFYVPPPSFSTSTSKTSIINTPHGIVIKNQSLRFGS
jgi:hypothetical protein